MAHTSATALPTPAAPSARLPARGISSARALLVVPALALAAALVLPLGLLVRTSFARRDASVYEGTGFTFETYLALAQPIVVNSVVFSVGLAVVVAAIALAISIPAVYFVTRLGRRGQTAWLIGVLSTLALSEVLVAFAWQVLLSRRAGLSNVAVWLGLIEEPMSLAPGLGAVIACVVYFVLPFSFITIYPGMSRLDRSFMEAAKTLGAHPVRAFFSVVVPNLRRPIVTAFAITTVLALGTFVPPIVLGGPPNWTIGVVISEIALAGQNLPLASAMAILLMAVTVGLVAGLGRLAAGPKAAP